MNLTMLRRAASCMWNACVSREGNPEQIPFRVQKGESFATRRPVPMPKKYTPESHGISSQYIEAFLHELEGQKESNVHNLLIYRDGDLLSSASAPGYSPRIWSLTHSLSKSVVSMVMGCLVREGKIHLDTPIAEILADDLPPIVLPRMRQITVRHLLKMRAAVADVNELLAITSTTWKRAFLASAPFAAPDSVFNYPSIHTHMLVCVMERVSGETFGTLLERELFGPLGIREYLVECSADGIAKGGWGMYITPIDMAKLGQLVLSGGIWDGKVILPQSYLKEAVKPHSHLTEVHGAYDYGMHFWISRDGESILLNGMMGQNVWVCPRTKMVIVATAGNAEFFQKSSTLETIDRYFGASFTPAGRLAPAPRAQAHLRRAEAMFFTRRNRIAVHTRHHDDPYADKLGIPLPPAAKRLLGSYIPEPNRVGILPLVTRLIGNNHTEGIGKIAFAMEGDHLVLEVTEGGVLRRYPLGYGEFLYREQDFRGEKYWIGGLISFAENEDGNEVVKIELVLPEMPNSRRIKLVFPDEEHMAMRLLELPGADVVDSIVSAVVLNNPTPRAELVGKVADIVTSDELFHQQVMRCMEPILFAVRMVEDESCDEACQLKKLPKNKLTYRRQKRL